MTSNISQIPITSVKDVGESKNSESKSSDATAAPQYASSLPPLTHKNSFTGFGKSKLPSLTVLEKKKDEAQNLLEKAKADVSTEATYTALASHDGKCEKQCEIRMIF
jgi:hypothetical protein